MEAIRERVRRNSLFDVCNTVGRISAVLYNSKGNREIQARIAEGLLGHERAAALFTRLAFHRAREIARGEGSPSDNYVLFGQPTLNALLQIAFTELPPDDAAPGADLTAIAEALLMLGEIIDQTPHNPGDASFETEEGRRRWAYYAATELVTPGTDPAIHLVVRAADLFLTEEQDLHDHPDHVDLHAHLLEATGLPPAAHMLSHLLFAGTMYGVTADNAAERNVVIDAGAYRGEHLEFTEEQIECFLRVGGMRAADVAAEARRFYLPDRLRPAFMLPFEQSPLVRFGDRAVCVSLPLLEKRMTSGLYHILFNSRRPEDPFRAKFMRFIGHRWARYVERAFARIATAECENARAAGRKPNGRRRATLPAARYIAEADLRAALDAHLAATGRRPRRGDTRSLCDGILVVGETAVLIENKAKMFSLAARSGEDEEQFFDRLDEITVDAARQLDATARHLADGAFVSIGLDPARVRRVAPVVVSLQEIMMTPVLLDVIEERVRAAGYLVDPVPGMATDPIKVIDPGDLEWLELIVEQNGATVPQVLSLWAQDPVGRGTTLSSWSAAAGIPGGLHSARLRYHAARWAQLSTQAVEYFRAHRNPDVPEPDAA